MSEGIKKVLGDVALLVNSDLKTRSVLTGEEKTLSDVSYRVPTGIYVLDKFLCGGVALGRVYELYGDYAEGKSTLAQCLMFGFQKFPGVSMLLDSEFTWDRSRALRMGHNPDRHMQIQIPSMEKGILTIESTITRLRMPGKGVPMSTPLAIIWDTISNTDMEDALDVYYEDSKGDMKEGKYKGGMMAKPRKLRDLMRAWSMMLPEKGCTLIFVSQTHSSPKSRVKQTSGGAAIKFWATKRIKVYREMGSKFDYPYPGAGIVISVHAAKSKEDPPFKTVHLPMINNTGFHNGYSLVTFLLDNDKKKEFVYKSRGDIILKGYGSEGENIALALKHLDGYIDEDPDLIPYMEACVDTIWDRLYPTT